MEELCRDGSLVIRLMKDQPADLDLMTHWLNRPHVKEWWDPDEPDLDVEGVRKKYGPRTVADSTTSSCIFELEGRPIGYLQFYKWSDHPQEVNEMELEPLEPRSYGMDLFIAEPDLLGIGIGTRTVRLACGYLDQELGASDVTLATEVINKRAQRCYEKAGFIKSRQILDTDTRDGERARCWMMRWRPAPPAPPQS
jgi:aminoglycoside 6'-N-acetyltransferase